jgi:hypothetical protein
MPEKHIAMFATKGPDPDKEIREDTICHQLYYTHNLLNSSNELVQLPFLETFYYQFL